ncbi:MAG TPA: DUF3592 domain-containing protein [Gemmataceae bacterium]|nr:DUF3592 domain-containing protein [Gemmataceae bacterium]
MLESVSVARGRSFQSMNPKRGFQVTERFHQVARTTYEIDHPDNVFNIQSTRTESRSCHPRACGTVGWRGSAIAGADAGADFNVVFAMFQWVVNSMRREQRGPGLPFAIFWSALVAVFCFVIVRGAARQLASASWPTTDGTITVSSAERKHSWHLEYAYHIAGQSYSSTTYAEDPMPIQGEQEVLRHIARYPVGAQVAVSYDPHDPTTAVLHPGLRGCTLWCMLFLTPFVVIGMGFWAGLLGWSRQRFDPADPRQVATMNTGAFLVHPQRRQPIATFLTYLGVMTAAVSWVGGMLLIGPAYWLFGGFLLDPPVLIPGCTWLVILTACVLATWRATRRGLVLVVDPIAQHVEVRSAGVASAAVPFMDIAGVSVAERNTGSEKQNRPRYSVAVMWDVGDPPMMLGDFEDPADADALATWLRQQLSPD